MKQSSQTNLTGKKHASVHEDSCCSHEPESAESTGPARKAGTKHTSPESGNDVSRSGPSAWIRSYWRPAVSFLILAVGLMLDHMFLSPWFDGLPRLIWYLAGYFPVALPVLSRGFRLLGKGDLFTEFFLMSIATIGAFLIGEYPEGVAVMLFYSVGELFQDHAVRRAKMSIRSLLDVRSETAHLLQEEIVTTVHPEDVEIGEVIRVLPGERVPLDGILLNGRAPFDTSALTGESKPRHFHENEEVLAGMINLNRVIEVRVQKSYENSSISRILELVRNASLRKAKTELFIRSFARVYTPAVVFLAALLVLLPAIIVSPYYFDEWLYRGLVFLVISCPCALVISIPLGYFGGIGAASRNGILVKGSNFLDLLRSVETVVFDKTGTLTRGVFAVQSMEPAGSDREFLISLLYSVEKSSGHPIAKAIVEYTDEFDRRELAVTGQREIPGRGIRASLDGREVAVGNRRLMEETGVDPDKLPDEADGTEVCVSIGGVYAGRLLIADEVKEEAGEAIRQLRELGVQRVMMLSGDSREEANRIGEVLQLDRIWPELMPDEKAARLEELKGEGSGVIAYVGDGINDAPVLALSDVGISMGSMGSDVAIETADVVIQADNLTKVATSMRIGRRTRNIVWQNIALAMGIKILVLGLGAFGLATLWEAVFADVGVALLAILNAIRIQKMDFSI